MDRFHSFDSWAKETFGKKAVKLSLISSNACPNRINGKKGCLFCSEDGSGHFTNCGSISKQIATQLDLLKNKWGSDFAKIAYFQSFTNTYQPVEKMILDIEEAISCGVDAVFIATRADCLFSEHVNYLENLSRRTTLVVELGLQTVNEETISLIERGYTHKEFVDGQALLKNKGINTLAQIIVGLPNETATDVYNTIEYVNSADFWGIKIHNLYIEYGSRLYDYYRDIGFKLLTKQEYICILVNAIAMLRQEIIVSRLTGDGRRDRLFYPDWTYNKRQFLGEIMHTLKSEKIIQGCNFKNKSCKI